MLNIKGREIAPIFLPQNVNENHSQNDNHSHLEKSALCARVKNRQVEK